MTDWKEGTVEWFKKGASVVKFKGDPKSYPVKESIRRIIAPAGWGTVMKFIIAPIDTEDGKKDGISAVEILKPANEPKPRSKGDFRSPIQIIRCTALPMAIEFIKVNAGTFSNDDGKITQDQVLNIADTFTEWLLEGRKV